MKKYAIAIKTRKNPITRICDFELIHDTVICYVLRSETIEMWIDKNVFEYLISNNETITPENCILFIE